MIMLVGPSGSGKSTIAKELQELGYNKIVTYTTRAPRPGEINGIDYYFVDEDEFKSLVKEGFFAEHTFYDGSYYGTPLSEIEPYKFSVIEPTGMLKIKSQDIPSISVFIDANRDERFNRLLKRGDGKDNALRRIGKDTLVFSSYVKDSCDIILDNNEEFTDAKLDRLIEVIDIIQSSQDKPKKPTYKFYI